MSTIKFKLITPERVAYESDIDQLSLPTVQGEITILPHHVPLVAVLGAGQLLVKKGDHTIPLAVSGGLVEVKQNEVVVLADTAERAEEIDILRAEEARARALTSLQAVKDRDAVEYANLAAKMEKELARLRVARKHKHGRTPASPESIS